MGRKVLVRYSGLDTEVVVLYSHAVDQVAYLPPQVFGVTSHTQTTTYNNTTHNNITQQHSNTQTNTHHTTTQPQHKTHTQTTNNTTTTHHQHQHQHQPDSTILHKIPQDYTRFHKCSLASPGLRLDGGCGLAAGQFLDVVCVWPAGRGPCLRLAGGFGCIVCV